MKILPVILCGGSGTRLWPMSRAKYPKQFMDLGNGETLFKDTVRRSEYLALAEDPLIVSNDAYRFYASAELKELGRSGTIILEPSARNTAPAIALAAFSAIEKGDRLLLVLPSDHKFGNPKAFCTAVDCAGTTAESGYLVTFGITPDKPETGYGYIKSGKKINENVYSVSHFLEKPDASKAAAMLAEGGYYWNSGMFFFRASAYLEELAKFAPKIYETVKEAWTKKNNDLEFVRPDFCFADSPKNSIDYAVMEHTNKAAVVPVDCGWSDLGSWNAFYDIAVKDSSGNVCEGDVLVEDSRNCYLRSSDRLVAAVNVENIAVVETKDAVLVTNKNTTQDVKHIVDKLKRDNRYESDFHLKVYRPWGNYETLAIGDRFQVKRIVIDPKQENSLQVHYHRSEHWVVVSGTAEVTINDKVQILTENESVYVPLGEKHRMRNPGMIPLVLIEVQSGSYLGEDDIIRFEDKYGRVGTEEK